MATDKRSPLKAKPLRLPGQSVDERRREIFDDRVQLPLLIAVLLVMLAALEWYRDFYPQPPMPWPTSAFAVCAVVYMAVRVGKALPELRALGLARDGERAVGQYLEELRAAGYHVLHDVLGQGFNVDHVLIGPAGVLTIETKTFSKRADSKVKFDGQAILVDGWEPDRDPVVQAKAQASWLSQLLKESTGRKFEVRPVVLFPGWFVEQSPGSLKELWVLNPKALKAFLDREPAALSPEDVKLASFHLSRYIRAREEEARG